MSKTINLVMRADDAEPILWDAARQAAKYGAWADYITRRTVNPPQDLRHRGEWQEKFLQAKRLVEAFGVEYERVSEEETLGVYIPHKVLKSHLVKVAGMTMRHVDKSVPDPKNAMPQYSSGICSEACKAAADRVVRAWRSTLEVPRRVQSEPDRADTAA
jgi:hypothetical protein